MSTTTNIDCESLVAQQWQCNRPDLYKYPEPNHALT